MAECEISVPVLEERIHSSRGQRLRERPWNFGFNSSTTGTHLQVVIPLGSFADWNERGHQAKGLGRQRRLDRVLSRQHFDPVGSDPFREAASEA